MKSWETNLRRSLRLVSERFSTRRGQRDPRREAARISWGNRIAIVLLIVTFAVSLSFVAMQGHETSSSGKVVLTLAHWQLELGVKDGLDYMARKYNQSEERKRRGMPEIEFKQIPIPDAGYSQWLTTQLMGGSPPDLVELGMYDYEMKLRYSAYYMVPITKEIFQPNPYNTGTDLEAMPWKNTFIDGMGEGVRELREYYTVGLSSFSGRLYFNRNLLRTVTQRLVDAGKIPKMLDEPPNNLDDFLALCDRIGELKDDDGRSFLPIAGSKYQFDMMNGNIVAPQTTVFLKEVDRNFDGIASADETLFAFLEGKLSFEDPRIKKIMTLSSELAKRFPPGWNGLLRDDGVMQFLQWRSVFIVTGSWDGGMLIEQARTAKHSFAVGITQFPVAKSIDPAVMGRRPYEQPAMGFPFGLTKTCKHPDVALDFLRFLTAQKNNQELNEKIGWIPCILGAKPSGFMSAFEPNFYGIRSGLAFNLGGQSFKTFEQITQLLQIGEDPQGRPYGIEDWCRDMPAKWLPAAVIDYEQRDETGRDMLPAQEAAAALLRATMLLKNKPDPPAMIGYYDRLYYFALSDLVNESPMWQIVESQRLLADTREKGLIK